MGIIIAENVLSKEDAYNRMLNYIISDCANAEQKRARELEVGNEQEEDYININGIYEDLVYTISLCCETPWAELSKNWNKEQDKLYKDLDNHIETLCQNCYGEVEKMKSDGMTITECRDYYREEGNKINFIGEEGVESAIEKVYGEDLPFWDDWKDKWVKDEDLKTNDCWLDVIGEEVNEN